MYINIYLTMMFNSLSKFFLMCFKMDVSVTEFYGFMVCDVTIA